MNLEYLNKKPDKPKENPRASGIANRGVSNSQNTAHLLYSTPELRLQAFISKKHNVSLPMARVIATSLNMGRPQ